MIGLRTPYQEALDQKNCQQWAAVLISESAECMPIERVQQDHEMLGDRAFGPGHFRQTCAHRLAIYRRSGRHEFRILTSLHLAGQLQIAPRFRL